MSAAVSGRADAGRTAAMGAGGGAGAGEGARGGSDATAARCWSAVDDDEALESTEGSTGDCDCDCDGDCDSACERAKGAGDDGLGTAWSTESDSTVD